MKRCGDFIEKLLFRGKELFRSMIERVSILLYFLFILFGLVSWTAANGVLSESPVLSAVLPECERVTSYIVIIVQCANIGPVVYLIARAVVRLRCRAKGSIFDISAIYLILSLGLLSGILLIFFWSEVTLVSGVHPVSTAFFILTGFLSISDCTSTVLFLPFVSLYPNAYISALYIGEGLSGVVPSVWALIQGSPTSTCEEYEGVVSGVRFSPTYYFIIIPLITTVSLVAFSFILILPVGKRERDRMARMCLRKNHEITASEENQRDDNEMTNSTDVQSLSKPTNINNCKHVRKLVEFVSIEVILCFFANSFLSSISPFFTLPYGPSAFVWALNLTLISAPVGSLLCGVLNAKSTKSLWCLLACYLLISAWLIFLAVWSGESPLSGSGIGLLHVVLLQAATGLIAGYVKVGVGVQAKNEGGTTFMLYIAAATQVGSLLGGLTAFVLVNYSNILERE